MKKLAVLLLWLCAAGFAAAQEAQPEVVPALQEWRGGKGKLTLQPKGRIVVDATAAKAGKGASQAPAAEADKLMEAAKALAADLKALKGWDYSVESGRPSKGCIFLSLTTDTAACAKGFAALAPERAAQKARMFGAEGYRLEVGKHVAIEAPSAKGAYWGTRSLLQMLCDGKAADDAAPGVLAKGVAVDWPEYECRGFMLDVARKFFTMDYLQQLVKVMSFYKMNELQVHLNDNGFPQFFDNDWKKTYAAFRLESERFPGLTAKDGSYTKAEFAELQRTGMKLGVNVVPEIDFPAHSLAMAHYKPNIASKKYGEDHLDLFAPETFTFLDSLLLEYIEGPNPAFVGPDLHIGTDEYHADVAERFRWFTDRYLKFVNAHGKNPRMWGSLRWIKGKTPVTAENVTINAWSYDWIDPLASLKAGYRLINTCDTYLYIVPAAGYYRDFLDARWLYNEWRVGKVNSREQVDEFTPGLAGGMFAVWNDICGNGISEQDVHYRVMPAMQVMSEKLWRGKRAEMPFERFDSLCRRLPEAPGVNLLARVKADETLRAAGTETVTLTGDSVVKQSIDEVGYPYKVSFEIKPAKRQNVSGILFKGPHSTLYTNFENQGKLAFSRDGYTFVFHGARLAPEEWSKVRIEGDYRGTTLYVNDRMVERLEGRTRACFSKKHNRKDYMRMQETLIFPLAEMGDKINGFKGEVRGLKVEQGAR